MPSRVGRASLAAIPGSAPAPRHDHGTRLPGIGGRFVNGLVTEALGHGWRDAELAGLVAAAEERSSLWLITPAPRPWATPEVRAWSAGQFISCDDDIRSLVLTAGAARGHHVCVAGASGRGRRAASISARLEAAGAQVGRIDAGVAETLGVAWTVEMMIAPLLTSDALRSLRDALVGAPRCGWCGVPVLGSRCRRCSGETA